MEYYREKLHIKEEQLRIAYDLIEVKNLCLQRQTEEIEELKLKVKEYYELWQSELMERDSYEDE